MSWVSVINQSPSKGTYKLHRALLRKGVRFCSRGPHPLDFSWMDWVGESLDSEHSLYKPSFVRGSGARALFSRAVYIRWWWVWLFNCFLWSGVHLRLTETQSKKQSDELKLKEMQRIRTVLCTQHCRDTNKLLQLKDYSQAVLDSI